MKQRNLILLILIGAFMLIPTIAFSQTAYQPQIKYVLRHLRITKEKKAELTPVLVKYYNDIAEAKAARRELKRKYGEAEKKGDLTPEQCNLLFQSKIKQEHAELDVREKYYEEFKKVLTTQQAYNAIRLANDKLTDNE